MRLLLEHGADVDAKDTDGGTALRRAAENGHEAVVRLLLEHVADVDAEGTNGGTALYQGGLEWARGGGATAAGAQGGCQFGG